MDFLVKGFLLAFIFLASACGGGSGGGTTSNSPQTPIEKVSSIDISAPADFFNLNPGQSSKITAVCICDGVSKDVSSLGEWSIDNKDVASISPDGEFHLKKFGYYTVDFKYKGTSSIKKISYSPATKVEEVNIQQDSLNSYVGEKLQLAFGVFDFLGHSINQPVNWSTSDETVVSVDGSGMITSLREGVAVVSAEFNNHRDQVNIVVNKQMTLVKGVIEGDVVWSIDGSPYQIDGILQIPYGSKLKIQEGVVFYGKVRQVPVTTSSFYHEGSYSPEFGIWGSLTLEGSTNNPVIANDVVFAQKSGRVNGVDFLGQLNLINTKIKNSNFGSSSGNLVINNSEFIDSYGPLVNYPSISSSFKSIITGNIFRSHKGIILDPSQDIIFSDNKFIESNSMSIWIRPIYLSKGLIFKKNTLDNQVKVYCDNSGASDPNYKLDISDNYWGTTDPSQISSMLIDKYDDLNYSCELIFSPYLLSQP